MKLFQHLNAMADMEDYRVLTESGFNPFIRQRLYHHTEKQMEDFFRKLRKKLKCKTTRDMGEDFLEYAMPNVADRDNLFELYVLENMTVEDIKKFQELFYGVADKDRIKMFHTIRRLFGMTKRPVADTLNQMDRLLRNEKGDSLNILIGHLISGMEFLSLIVGKEEAASIIRKAECYSELEQASKEKDRERIEEDGERCLQVILNAGRDGDFRKECKPEIIDEKHGCKIGLTTIDNPEFLISKGIKENLSTMGLDKDEALVYVEYHMGKVSPSWVVRVNGRTGEAMVLRYCSQGSEELWADIVQWVSSELAAQFRAAFLNRQLVNLP